MLPENGWNGWKPRITSSGELYPLSDKLAVKLQLEGYACTCCSHTSLKLSCTSHKTAEINGVQVLTLSLNPNIHAHTYTQMHTQFTAGEPLEGVQSKEWNNPHAGSIFTAKVTHTHVTLMYSRAHPTSPSPHPSPRLPSH